MAISICKGSGQSAEGSFRGEITGIRRATWHGFDQDAISVKVKTPSGYARALCKMVMDEDTFLGKFVAAVNSGAIPAYVEDLETFLLGKDVMVEVTHRPSKKTGQVFANVVDVWPLPKASVSTEATLFQSDEGDEEIVQAEEDDAAQAVPKRPSAPVKFPKKKTVKPVDEGSTRGI